MRDWRGWAVNVFWSAVTGFAVGSGFAIYLDSNRVAIMMGWITFAIFVALVRTWHKVDRLERRVDESEDA